MLALIPEMAVDDHGLVHGGFIFGLADYAAMVAINDPNVVLGIAAVKFLKPAVIGDELVAKATKKGQEGRKYVVKVDVRREEEIICTGDFTCFVPDKHVLD